MAVSTLPEDLEESHMDLVDLLCQQQLHRKRRVSQVQTSQQTQSIRFNVTQVQLGILPFPADEGEPYVSTVDQQEDLVKEVRFLEKAKYKAQIEQKPDRKIPKKLASRLTQLIASDPIIEQCTTLDTYIHKKLNRGVEYDQSVWKIIVNEPDDTDVNLKYSYRLVASKQTDDARWFEFYAWFRKYDFSYSNDKVYIKVQHDEEGRRKSRSTQRSSNRSSSRSNSTNSRKSMDGVKFQTFIDVLRMYQKLRV